jgi:hypothetical protein
MRLAALRRFRLAEELTEREWRMVFYGLADNDPLYPDRPILLEDDTFFPESTALSKKIESKALKRKDWAALCSSYFAYSMSRQKQSTLVCTTWTYCPRLLRGESRYPQRKIMDENH